ncbi:cbs domain protein, putative [Heliomicrobium modesticaldum Ice1]|uniref:Cbs domain protein, putative n=1 Tax=Heliobacterium modesticaldum (strain ATCC 51547 / Ice1) TaxID=498761 RepID=B0TEC3_HELMI|nr:CBS domain-containing protein [Heliomicrobium modesticaldum]ABZ85605.1 cbs domain protein, putative [Heliomicrobium modesticaldum Ice1]
MRPLREIMTRSVSAVRPDETIIEAAKIMMRLNVGAVPVVEGQKCVGIITDRDIVLRVVAKGMDPRGTTIQSAMTKDPITGTPDMDIHAAADLMSDRQIRRLPIIENDRLVGIVSLGDLAVTNIYRNEAGDALGEISEPSRPM